MKDRIFNVLSKHTEGLKASQIAKLINAERKSVNSYLYGQEGKKYFEIDCNYVWKIKKSNNAHKINKDNDKHVSNQAIVFAQPPITQKRHSEHSFFSGNKEYQSRAVFWVYQNRTYYEEKAGGFLWSPKYTQNGRRHPGYETMKEVKPGDIIIHSYKTHIVAMSIAKTRCFSCDRPSLAFSDWALDGWKIECDYYVLPSPLSIRTISSELYEIQPSNGPLIASKTGKQQYLCNATKRMLDCILNLYELITYNSGRVEALLSFLNSSREKFELKSSENTNQNSNEKIQRKKILKIFVEEGCKIKAKILNYQKDTVLSIDTSKFPKQKHLIGMMIGDVFQLEDINLTYKILEIWTETKSKKRLNTNNEVKF